jgi:putative lipoic acid-binding regulatory protein
MNKKFNGNGKGKSLNLSGPSSPIDQQEQQIEFPVTYQLKAVMTGTRYDDENKQDIVDVLSKLDIVHAYLDKKVSSKGTYTSFTYEVTLISKDQMYKMYAQLRTIKNLKFAL